MRKWYLCLICLTIFLIPANLFLKLDLSHAYIHGLLIDYLIPKLYASDLPILLILVLWSRELIKQKKSLQITKPSSLFIVLGIATIGLRQFLTENPTASLWFFIKLLEMIIFSSFLSRHQEVLKSKWISITVFFTLLFQSGLGIAQFYFQTSIFHSYLVLGEVNFAHPIGLAKDSFFASERILPYGTTAHPNVLAGFLVIGILITLHSFLKNQHRRLVSVFILGISFFALLLTQSISAYLTLIIGICMLLLPKTTPKVRLAALCCFFGFIFIPFIIHFGAVNYPGNQSLTRRDVLNQAAIAMIIDQPILGVGLNEFTAVVEQYRSSKEVVQFDQPAHNIFFLWLAETGGIGVILGSYLLWKYRQKIAVPLLILLPIITLDHYLLTQQTGLLLSILFFTFRAFSAPDPEI